MNILCILSKYEGRRLFNGAHYVFVLIGSLCFAFFFKFFGGWEVTYVQCSHASKCRLSCRSNSFLYTDILFYLWFLVRWGNVGVTIRNHACYVMLCFVEVVLPHF